MNKPLLTLALTLSCTAAGAASPPATLPASVAACLRVTDAGQRLACYDQSVAALLPAAAPPAPVAATTPAVKAPPAAPARSAAMHGLPRASPISVQTCPSTPGASRTVAARRLRLIVCCSASAVQCRSRHRLS